MTVCLTLLVLVWACGSGAGAVGSEDAASQQDTTGHDAPWSWDYAAADMAADFGGQDAVPADTAAQDISAQDTAVPSDAVALDVAAEVNNGEDTQQDAEAPECQVAEDCLALMGAPEDCLEVVCDEGQCLVQDLPDGSLCDDGNLCTAGDVCQGGGCYPGVPVTCQPPNPCMEGSCKPQEGCVFTPLSGFPCEDGDPCTGGDVCEEGTCVAGEIYLCGNCETNGDCGEFEDGNPCNGTLVCVEQTCQVDPDTIVSCDTDGDPQCEVTACNPQTGECEAGQKPDGVQCDDGSVCTFGETCQGGECQGTKLDCTDQDPCTVDVCDPVEGCVHFDGCACDDQDPCTVDYVDPVSGECVNEPLCVPESACETVSCVDGQCVPEQIDCDDDDACTTDSCKPAIGCVHKPVLCEDDDACTDNQCDPEQGCVFPATTCDDQDDCTQDSCVPGLGCTHKDMDCDDDNPCTLDSCQVQGGCQNEPSPLNGNPCDDGDPCTQDESCQGGLCAGGTDVCDEICDNVIDDDGDGLVDCQDTECAADPHCQANWAVCEAGESLECGGSSIGNLSPIGGQMSTYSCSNFLYSWQEQVWTYQATCNGTVTASLFSSTLIFPQPEPWRPPESAPIVELFVLKDLGGGCSAGNCLAFGPMVSELEGQGTAAVTFQAQAGETYYFVADARMGFGSLGSTIYSLELGCACAAEECDDGADNDGDGQVDCDDADCDADPYCAPEADCIGEEPISCGGTDWGLIPVLPGGSLSSYPCSPHTYPKNERIYTFQPDCNGPVTVNVISGLDLPIEPEPWLPPDGDPVFLDVMVLEETAEGGCSSQSCVAFGAMSSTLYFSKATASFIGDMDKTYYIVVDGRSGSSGEYTLVVSCDLCF